MPPAPFHAPPAKPLIAYWRTVDSGVLVTREPLPRSNRPDPVMLNEPAVFVTAVAFSATANEPPLPIVTAFCARRVTVAVAGLPVPIVSEPEPVTAPRLATPPVWR